MTPVNSIGGPQNLKKLNSDELPELMDHVRRRIIDVTLKNGGHMASSLGAVELITALLRVFDPLEDKIVFDVGHQAYAWKLLTDRADRFDTLRTEGGISGYPKMNESPCDHFGVGHSSTSLSAALGYALARDLQGQKHHVIAVIGDGAIINGEAFEALNHAGSLKTPVIYVLNDNRMAISPRVGGMAMHLARLSTSAFYKGAKNMVKRFCRNTFSTDRVYRCLNGVKEYAKKALNRPNLFDDMGFTYWGPFDGHDEQELEQVFRLAKNYGSPLLIHVVTCKGKGYEPAETNPVAYHGVSPAASGASKKGKSWSAAAASCMEAHAAVDARVVALTPAMAEGSALGAFRERFPDRFFDVGIAEEHMITLAAAMAAGGLRPVACIYSTFLQRAMDQLVHDICLQNLPVVIAVDRAGLVGDDGETHQGLFDANWCSVVPNLQVWSPYDEASLIYAFDRAFEASCPVLVRYPRGSVPAALGEAQPGELWDSGVGPSWALVATGTACAVALEASALAESRAMEKPRLIFLNKISPLPEGLAEKLAGLEFVITAEEAYEPGGLGQRIGALCRRQGLACDVQTLALPLTFVAQGSQARQRQRLGLTPERILSIYECYEHKKDGAQRP